MPKFKVYSQRRPRYTYYEIHQDGCGCGMHRSNMSFTSAEDAESRDAIKVRILAWDASGDIHFATCAQPPQHLALVETLEKQADPVADAIAEFRPEF